MDDRRFVFVGRKPGCCTVPDHKEKHRQKKPLASLAILAAILLGCACCGLFIPKDPAYMDLANASTAPCREFWFGTDAMGRDIFSMVWYGGRLSLLIGFLAAAIAAVTAVLYGTFSGFAPQWLDGLLMRLAELLLSVPNLLLVILLQAVLGEADVIRLSVVIGMTSWFGIAKVVRTEVLQLRGSEYVVAARCMGAGFFHILRRHLAPNFISSILFMIVMNIRNAIVVESTLSFMGIGLPLEVISWGSMLSLSERALLGGAWWMIVIPGVFLILTLVCVTDIGNALQKRTDRRQD